MIQASQSVRTRMAPSPTGELHVGGLAMALKNFAWARKNQGQFVLRIEDTDQAREVEGAIERLTDILRTFNLFWDEGPEVGGEFGPYIQSQRLEIYQQKAEELVSNDEAYYCFCSRERLEEVRQQMIAAKKPPMYDRHCRSLTEEEVRNRLDAGGEYVIRLKVPDDRNLQFLDLIRGKITFNSSSVDDQVLLKSDGFPTYHLAVVIDDHLMNISHVFRGEEWISSAPKHILLYEAFGWERPVFCHFPVFLNPDGKGKMSKRKGTVSVESFLERGYLPEALLNFLMILGWSPEDEDEIMSLERYIAEFEPTDVSAKSVIFDLKKLDWLNGIYIRKLSDQELIEKLKPYLPSDFPLDQATKIIPLVKERLVTLADIEELTDFFYRDIPYDYQLLLKKADAELVKSQILETVEKLNLLEVWQTNTIEDTIRSLEGKNKWHRGQYFMMLRIAVTGKKYTPPLFETMSVLNKETCLRRLQEAAANI